MVLGSIVVVVVVVESVEAVNLAIISFAAGLVCHARFSAINFTASADASVEISRESSMSMNCNEVNIREFQV